MRVEMVSGREYLKELIDRGESLQKPQYNANGVHSALSLINVYPSDTAIRDWKRDVQAFNNKYLKSHFAFQLITQSLNTMGLSYITSTLRYLENVYNDYTFWDAFDRQENVAIQIQAGKERAMYDVFISHANADKIEYVDKLKQSLDRLKIKVFYDKDTIGWGDNMKNKILEGVQKAEFAIIVISENYFGREWTEKELNEFLNRQNASGQKIILPIVHNITIKQLQDKYPAIANIQALDSSKYSCEQIALEFASQLINRLKGNGEN
ncbi:MAG: toll/interleukin-1 receptor domain-containing protein [Clostridia bacterium]|nr:toll/interleukin-1 receptor domain-containing protein [Clostridia bacterium]